MAKSALSKKQPPRTVAVIDIGSSAIRLVVVEIASDGSFKRLDRASRPVSLGRDVFLNRIISKETMNQSIRILSGFCEMLDSWGIEQKSALVIATAAIREARNRDTFSDRVFIRTGLRIEIVEGVEENHLTYIAVLHAIEELQATFARTSTLIMEVGGGSTEFMILDRGKMVASHSLRMGTLRVDRFGAGQHDSGQQLHRAAQDQYRSTLAQIKTEYDLSRIKYFIMVGGDARITASKIGTRPAEHYSRLSRKDFLDFADQVGTLGFEGCVKQFNITYYEAESLVPSLGVYKIFLEETSCEEIIVPDVSIREGVLLRFVLGQEGSANRRYQSQIFASARALGKKYHFDEPHGMHVANLAMAFYDQFRDEHRLGDREQLWLQIAALLHDIGYFVRASGHHKHGQYIIANSELFGLSYEELEIIGQIVRYHRSTRPPREHPEYVALTQEHRISVLKLTAILRVCDALDRSHTQRIKDISVEIKDEEDLIITASYLGDVTPERQALEHKGDVFEDVFGYHPILI